MNYPTARDEQAAYWYLRLQDADVSAAEIQEGLHWQRQCPENQAAFDRIAAFWRAWPPAAEESTAAGQSGFKRSWLTRRGWLAAAAALVFASIGAWLVLSWRLHHEASVSSNEYTTAVGQLRTVTLQDGSEVVLGGATSIRTSFSSGMRAVSLTDGEALFRVKKDATRPFVVSAAEGVARAVGTAFDVHRGPEGTTVTVVDGLVEVRPPSGAADRTVQLHPGDQVSLALGGELGRPRHVNADEVTSWRTGRKVFIDQSLLSVVADLNRYSAKPIALAATDAGGVRITGTVKIDGIEPWLQALGPLAGVNVTENEYGIVLAAPPRKQKPL
jgi:transmembrane sensor